MNFYFKQSIQKIREILCIGRSFDIIERNIMIGEKQAFLYYIDGFIKDDIMQLIFTDFFRLTCEDMEELTTAQKFISGAIPYVEVSGCDDCHTMANEVLCGQTALLIEGYSKGILMDLRTYPTRSIAEPEKEKTLRGARDGLVETIIFNTAMIRRRIRDPQLVFAMNTIGSISKTNVVMGYMKGIADEKKIEKIEQKIASLQVESLTVGDQSLVEAMSKTHWLNPFPKVRYTERPDVAAAHLNEGRIILLIDNSPTAMILPTFFLDFLQDVDDYYFPVMTGNYFKMIRHLTMLSLLFLTPFYLLLTENITEIPDFLLFIIPTQPYSIPIFWQFILLEVAIDGLKLASLNTPSSLGMSLSVIGALILGEFSVSAGILLPQTILCMAIVALGGFSQPSVELSYAIKFVRITLLLCTYLLGVIGMGIGTALFFFVLLFTKTLTGESYLFPLVPFHWKALKRLLFRTKMQS